MRILYTPLALGVLDLLRLRDDLIIHAVRCTELVLPPKLATMVENLAS